MQVVFLILLFIFGSAMGSFLCCEARRLHSNKKFGPRSVCLNCKYQLKWYDNIPIFSWLFLRGKCRKCHKKIGIAEFLVEIGVALAFLMIGTTIDITAAGAFDWAIFIVTLILILVLSFLAIYDGLYGELPVVFLILAIIIAAATMVLKSLNIVFTTGFTVEIILNPLFAVMILGGVYLVLYLVSKGKWVGDGDWLLGVALALAVSSPWLALIILFISNVVACIVMLPIVKKSKNTRIHFGPFMVVAFVITVTFANFFYYAIGA